MIITKTNESPHFSDVETLIEGLGYRVVDYSIERIKSCWQARVVIFAPSGTGIDDCVKVHRPLQQRLEVLLDSQDLNLEVSSPGVNRVLKKAYELKAFLGLPVSIWDLSCTEWVTGLLVEYNDAGVVLEIEGNKKTIEFSNIKKAKRYMGDAKN